MAMDTYAGDPSALTNRDDRSVRLPCLEFLKSNYIDLTRLLRGIFPFSSKSCVLCFPSHSILITIFEEQATR